MSARRGRMVKALALGYAFRVALATLLAFPLATVVAASGIRSLPGGDALLFEPGGLFLLEVLVSERSLLGQLIAPSFVLLLLGAIAGLVPEWILLLALRSAEHDTTPARARSLGQACRDIGRLAILRLVSWIARGALVLATLALAMTARSLVAGGSDERLPTLAAAAAGCLGLAGWLCSSIWHDVAAIGVAHEEASPTRAISGGLIALRLRGLRLFAVYTSVSVASFCLVAAVAPLVARIDVGRAGDAPLLGVLLAHQVVIVLQLVLRAAWLRSAIGTVVELQQPADS